MRQQVSYFPDGGFVIHKVIGGNCSAWYDKNGLLLDCERKDKLGRMRKPNADLRRALAAVGKYYVRGF